MEWQGDRRGQSVLVGAILLFGILVIALAIVQAEVVPTENRAVEFDHNQQVQGELIDVRNAIIRAGSVGNVQPVSVQLGTRYPQRTVTVNPPAAAGSVTVGPMSGSQSTLNISNAVAVGDTNTGDFWDGSEKAYPIAQLRYEPEYAEYHSAPATIYESSIIYNEFENGQQMPLTGQRLIDGRSLSFIALDGSLSERDVERVSIDPRAVSVSTRTVTVTGDGGPITITVRTDLSEDDWEGLLQSEIADGYVVGFSVDETNGILILELDGSERYTLRMGLVTIGSTGSENPAYITDITRDGSDYVVEVRDRFNNPVSTDVDVFEGDFATPEETNQSNSEGRVRYTYTGNDDLAFTINGVLPDPSASSPEQVIFEMTAVGPDPDAETVGPEIVDILATPSTILTNESFVLEATADSIGPAPDAFRSGTPIQRFQWAIDGNWGSATSFGSTSPTGPNDWSEIYTANTTIQATELGSSGTYDIQVRGQDATGRWSEVNDIGEVTITIQDPEPDGPFFTVSIDSTNSPITEGDTLEVHVTVENIGDETDTQEITLSLDGGVGQVDAESVSLDEGQQTTITLTWSTQAGDAGDYTATVASEDDDDSADISVDEPEPSEAQFVTLQATSNQVSSQATEVSITYSVSDTPPSNEVVFTVTDSNGGTNSVTAPATTSENTITVSDFAAGQGNNAPLEVRAEITDGQCLLYDNLGRDSTVTLEEFETCS